MFERIRKNRFGFTITELLIALTIIGAIAAMSIPALVENLHRKTMVEQVKGFYTTVQELAREQLVVKNTKNLEDTDFADPQKILSDKYFQIPKVCSTAAECWSESYKNLNGAITTRVIDENADTGKSIKIKNGAIITYTTQLPINYPIINGTDDKVVAMFRIDVNGNEKPNIVGRDVFWFLLTKKGKVVDFYTALNQIYEKEKALTECKSAATITACLSLIQRNNWVMDY